MPDGIAARLDIVNYTGADERLLDAVLAHPSSALLSRAGARPGGGLGVTVGGTPEAATIAPGGGIITDSGGGGSFRFVIPTAVSINLATRPGAGTSRIDEVVAVIKNVDSRPADGTREVDLQVVTGTAGASPTAPTIPTGALRLAELAVPASGTVSVSKPPPRIAAAGGIIIVSDQTERDAISPLFDGIVVYREDFDIYEARVNGAWQTIQTTAGWQTFALSSMAAGWATTTCRYHKTGDKIELNIEFTNPTVTSTAAGNLTDVTIGSVPAALRPSSPVPLKGSKLTTLGLGYTLNPDGSLVLAYTTAPSTSITSGISLRDSYALG